MYESFFHLRCDPFVVSPDPEFLYPTRAHTEAVAGLFYGLQAQKGLMVLTGEVGTGKTLVLRCLLRSLNPQQVACAYVFHTLLAGEELLRFAMAALGAEAPAGGKAELLLQLGAHLARQHQRGITSVLILDEAQNLTIESLEEVRLLTNLETAEAKVLQVVLAGQPELDEKLDSFPLRQLRQRVTLRFHLPPLSGAQTQAYIERRMRLAGGDASAVFSPGAVDRLYGYSSGIPRLINVLAGGALLAAFGLGIPRVTAALIDEVAADLRMVAPAEPRARRSAAAAHPCGGPNLPVAGEAADQALSACIELEPPSLARAGEVSL